jgi:hypothetical protein
MHVFGLSLSVSLLLQIRKRRSVVACKTPSDVLSIHMIYLSTLRYHDATWYN